MKRLLPCLDGAFSSFFLAFIGIGGEVSAFKFSGAIVTAEIFGKTE
jgi:hypothetical protein